MFADSYGGGEGEAGPGSVGCPTPHASRGAIARPTRTTASLAGAARPSQLTISEGIVLPHHRRERLDADPIRAAALRVRKELRGGATAQTLLDWRFDQSRACGAAVCALRGQRARAAWIWILDLLIGQGPGHESQHRKLIRVADHFVNDERCARVAFTVSRTSMNALRAQRCSRASERHSCTAFTVNVIL